MNNHNPPDQVLDEARKGLQDLMTRSGLSRETFLGFLTANPNAQNNQLLPQLDTGLSPIVKEETAVEGRCCYANSEACGAPRRFSTALATMPRCRRMLTSTLVQFSRPQVGRMHFHRTIERGSRFPRPVLGRRGRRACGQPPVR